MLIVVFSYKFPRPVRSRDQDALEYFNFLLESQIDVSLKSIVLVSGVQLILIWEITGHERQPDGDGKGEGVVAVLEGVRLLLEDEVALIAQSVPVEDHKECKDDKREIL